MGNVADEGIERQTGRQGDLQLKKEEIGHFYSALRNTRLGTIESFIEEYVEQRLSPIVILNEGPIGAMGYKFVQEDSPWE